MTNEILALALHYGWEEECTGGGCDALHKDRPTGDGSYWLITEEGGCSIPRDITAPVMRGAYRQDGEALDVIPATFPTTEAAMLDALTPDYDERR
jgi:hypothetical protein